MLEAGAGYYRTPLSLSSHLPPFFFVFVCPFPHFISLSLSRPPSLLSPSTETTAKVISMISAITVAFPILTYLIFPQKRAFPSRLPLYMCLAIEGVYFLPPYISLLLPLLFVVTSPFLPLSFISPTSLSLSCLSPSSFLPQ